MGAFQSAETGSGGGRYISGDVRAESHYLTWLGLKSHYYVVGGCLLSLSLCNSGFHDLLRDRPSSLLMLCGCISISIASLMRRSMYPVFAEWS